LMFGERFIGALKMSSKRSRWYLCTLVVLGVVTGLACSPSEPKEASKPNESSKPSEQPYVSAEGGFRVHFLVMPTVKKVAVPAGESTMYEAEVDGVSYGVSWIPVRLGARDEEKAYLEEVARAFAAQPFVLRTRVSAEITLDGRPGRELGVQTQVGEMHLRWYVSSGRLYQVMVMGPVEAIDSEAVKRFFASFAFNP
jgi:hypothetical protein